MCETTPYNPLDHIKTPEQLEAYVQERIRARGNTYGYGVVDKHGVPNIDWEVPFCTDPVFMKQVADDLDEEEEDMEVPESEARAPYHVVRLVWVYCDDEEQGIIQ